MTWNNFTKLKEIHKPENEINRQYNHSLKKNSLIKNYMSKIKF